jgi:crcB protein
MLKAIILVGIGGGTGSILRYLTSHLVAKYFDKPFPLSTFVVNMLGCFAMGLLIGIIGRHLPVENDLRNLLLIGFCGGYTTFSAFAYENTSLLQSHQYFTLISYVVLSVILGMLLLWFGLSLTRHASV